MKGKIVLVPFPFDDLSELKVRPAVCLMGPIGSFSHVVIAYISSRLPAEIQTSDLLVKSSAEGFPDTGLRTTSVIRIHRLVTISPNIIERELGSLPKELVGQLEEKIRDLFGISG